MEAYISILKHTPVFQGLEEGDIDGLLPLLGGRKKAYEKGSFIFYSGDVVHHIGIVLQGSVHIIQEDYWGNRNILAVIGKGNMFGEAFACLPEVASTVSVAVAAKSEVLFIDVSRLMQAGSVLTKAQEQVARNLLAAMAGKTMRLTEKIRYMSQRSTRQKLMFFLSDQARSHQSASFAIPFNRQELADFLSVDRSAMSAELSKMKREGLLDYHKEQFTLYHEDE